MEAHFFDLETYSSGDRPDPETDTIITVQFQKFDLNTGEPLGRLQILKQWELGEEEMLRMLHKWFFSSNPWRFIPVGFNLNFEWRFLVAKFQQYGIDNRSVSDFFETYPQLDLKVFAVIKQGSFKGASLSSISNKQEDGEVIKELYEDKNYQGLVEYVEQEAESFLDLYKKIRKNIDEIL